MATKIQGGAATKAVQTSGRKLMGGAAIPIAIVTDDDPRPTVAGAALPIEILEAGDRPTMGGAALPVRIVESTAGPVMAGAAVPAVIVQGSLGNWLTGYSYRKRIPIVGQAGAGEDYQIPLEVQSGPGTDAAGLVYLTGHCEDFPNDIRFTDDDGISELDHWLQSKGENGAWCWFQDPRAIRYSDTYDKTYFGVVTTDGDVKIFSYNHSTKVLNGFTLKTGLQVNDHAVPSILVRNDGKLIVFWSGHNGANIYYRISTNVEDISAWGVEQSISPQTDHSYPTPIQLSGESNKIYLFFRGGPDGHQNKWHYVTSVNGGIDWSASTCLLDEGATGEHQYLKIESNGVDKIYFAHSGHPANEVTSIYFFYYVGGSYYKADDTEILGGLPFDRADLDLVYNAAGGGNYRAWVWDIAVSGTTYYIVFAHFVTTTDHRYDYARWTGLAWDVNEITTAGTYIGKDGAAAYYSGGVALDHEDPTYVYLSKVISSQWEIQKWHTPNGGSSWDSPVDITSNSAKQNIRPVVIRNHASDLVALWMYGDYRTYTTYNTTIFAPELATEAKFWIEVKDDLGSNQNFYIYYGKPSTTSDSDGDNTFLFFDDFFGLGLDIITNWTVRQGAVVVGYGSLELTGTVGVRGLIDGQTAVSYPKAIEAKVRAINTHLTNCHFCGFRQSNSWNNLADVYGEAGNTIRLHTIKAGVGDFQQEAVEDITIWHRYKVIWESTQARAYQDDSLEATRVADIPVVDLVAIFYESATVNVDVLIDWVFVRKHNNPEPAVGTAGAEEEV